MEAPFKEDESLSDYMPALYAMGFPTFEEFRKNPDAYRNHPDEIFKCVDGSTQLFRDKVKRQKYFWKDLYQFDSLEQIERVCKDEGVNPMDLEIENLVHPIHGTSNEGQVEIHIRFWPKWEWAAKGKIVTNA